MEKLLVVLCILALGVTAVDGYSEFTGEDPFGFTTQDDEEDNLMSTIETVTVPDNMIRELVHYDHTSHMELRSENKSSGEWNLFIIDVSGQELIKLPGTQTEQDGFGEPHSVLYLRRELAAQFSVFVDSDDGEQLTSDGEYDVQRDEFTDLSDARVILIETNANISVDELQSTNVPLSFRGFLRNYFDPNEDKLETLAESIYGEGQTIELGQEGDWEDPKGGFGWGEDNTYEWVAERGLIIAGYETLLINISSNYGTEDFSIPFMEQLWLSNEVSEPVKQFIRTNMSWDSEEEAGYIVIENTFTLRDDGFTEGTTPIPWDTCQSTHWLQEHPLAIRESWNGNFMPISGTDVEMEESSFDMDIEDMIDWLEVNHPSVGLDEFLSNYPDSIITSARYNASKDNNDDIAGEYWWNLSFGRKRSSSEDGPSSQYKYRYQAMIYQNIDFVWVNPPGETPYKEYTNTFRLEWERGPRTGSAGLGPSDITPQTVTMTSSEDIFRTDDKVMENFYTYGSIEVDELDWGEGDGVGYSLGSSSGWGTPGLDLVATLTGIQMAPSAKYYWQLENNDLMEGGVWISASLDAETGQLITITEIEGTALQNALNFG